MMKKLLSLALAMAMVLCLLPAVQLTADAAELPKLAAPTDVELGYRMDWQWNEETQTGGQVKVSMPGSLVYKAIYPHQNQFRVELFKVGQEEPITRSTDTIHNNTSEEPRWMEDRYFCVNYEDWGSGTYYATVVAEGDGINYASSDPVKTPEWTYVKPEAKLGKCTNPAWDGTKMTWKQPENSFGYDIEVIYAPDKDAEPTGYHGIMSYYHAEGDGINEDLADLPWVFQEFGVGYYYFKVRALSSDINKWCHSEWSEVVGPYYLDTHPVNSKLEEVLTEDKTPDEVLEAVQAVDSYSLKEALLADQQAVDNIAQLEEKVGGAAAVEVSKEAAAFAGQDISIVGANLNKSSADAQDVKLVIDKPEKDHILPTQYNNAVAVKFSMDLENVANTEDLAVPVKITMPVPANINSRFLVVLHYHADGTMEEVQPFVETVDGKTYASFVLTSFSDFVMTERPGFTDVADDAYYADPVRWAVTAGITKGVTDTTFAPDATCTRGQFVTLLWRYISGSPMPATCQNPFQDISSSDYFYDAVLWAAENGITSGTSATTFSPDAPCTRGQIATFLWRFMGQQKASTGNIFSDIASNAYYYDAVLWAVENGVTKGMGDGTFAPEEPCTRAQIVTFLYRLLA